MPVWRDGGARRGRAPSELLVSEHYERIEFCEKRVELCTGHDSNAYRLGRRPQF